MKLDFSYQIVKLPTTFPVFGIRIPQERLIRFAQLFISGFPFYESCRVAKISSATGYKLRKCANLPDENFKSNRWIHQSYYGRMGGRPRKIK